MLFYLKKGQNFYKKRILELKNSDLIIFKFNILTWTYTVSLEYCSVAAYLMIIERREHVEDK
jgi:hypothetical protein